MIALEQQDRVEVYVSVSGSIVLSQQGSGCEEPDIVALRPENVAAVVRALRQTLQEWKNAN